MAHVNIQLKKLAAAYRWANLLPTAPERRYACEYINWLRGGAEGFEPERGGISKAKALNIRTEIDSRKLWEGTE